MFEETRMVPTALATQNIDPRLIAMFSKTEGAVGVQGSFNHFVEPSRALTEHDTQYTMELPNTSADYTDLKNIELYVRGKLKRADGTALEAEEEVVLTNNCLHSLFESINLQVGHNQQEIQISNYPYKAFLRQMMNAKTISSPDCRGHGFTDEARSEGIPSWSWGMPRMEWTAKSKTVEFMAPTFIDLFQTEGYLLPSTPLKIIFQRSSPEFYITTSEANKDVEYKFFIEKIGLYVPTVKVATYMLPLLEIQTDELPARYNFDSINVKQFSVPANTSTRAFSRVYQGNLPTKIAVAFYKQTTFLGDKVDASLLTEVFDLQSIQLLVNGLVVREHKLNVDEAICMEAYRRMTEWFEVTHTDTPLDMDQFMDGSGLFTFDLMENCSTSDCTEESLRTGFIDLRIKCRKPIPEEVVMLAYAFSPDSLDLTKDRAARHNITVM